MSQRQVIFGVAGVAVAAVLGGAVWSEVSPRLAVAQSPRVLVAQAEPAVREIPQTQADIQLSFAPVVKQVTPAVVNVYATKTEQGFQSPFANDPFFSRFFGGDMFQSRP